jgi:V-type H+-transporting ATPase 16kDa proteolipid subunit
MFLFDGVFLKVSNVTLFHFTGCHSMYRWGTWKAGLGLCGMSVNYPGGIIKNLVAIVMAGVLAIYGLIVAIIISGGVGSPADQRNTYSQYNGWAHLCAGLCCGLTCLAAGGATGIAGEVGILSTGLRAELNHARANARVTSSNFSREVVDEGDAGKLYIGSVTILSFSGAIGLYGFIIALIITSSTDYRCE